MSLRCLLLVMKLSCSSAQKMVTGSFFRLLSTCTTIATDLVLSVVSSLSAFKCCITSLPMLAILLQLFILSVLLQQQYQHCTCAPPTCSRATNVGWSVLNHCLCSLTFIALSFSAKYCALQTGINVLLCLQTKLLMQINKQNKNADANGVGHSVASLSNDPLKHLANADGTF